MAAEKEAHRPAHTPAEAQAIVDRVVESLGHGERVETDPQEVCITGWRAAVVIPERKGDRLELSQALQDGDYGIVCLPRGGKPPPHPPPAGNHIQVRSCVLTYTRWDCR